ncbi:hypothetical protein [Streptomyces sp. ME19-01-6]|uniref:hypothetical protein n=1 Tax=Streptomyces sp. ME19-01-6 TaxID=3028686 RepID=UPI0029ADA4CA|nr:hypothetical protein [Streptomyces sp. ME19-01-6]MDX3225812.1 tyrosinase family oxidase copper chaperone [Streptomyces sp. ME19-01-6]
MRNSIVRTLATGAAAALLAGGAAATSTSTASAQPSPTPTPTMTGKHCKEIKDRTKTITHNGKTYKVWIEGHKVCVMK